MGSHIAKGFWSYVNKTDGCWEWTGGLSSAGYGRATSAFRRTDYAHRIAWREAHGEIPVGMFVCHTCDNPKCVRIDHLFLGTPKDNAQDMAKKGRSFAQAHPERVARGEKHSSVVRRDMRPRGESSGTSKLTAADVLFIIEEAKKGATVRAIAKKLSHVSASAVGNVVTGRCWAHATSPKDLEQIHLLRNYGMRTGWPEAVAS